MTDVQMLLPMPIPSNVVGEFPVGNKVCFRHFASGYDINVPIKKNDSSFQKKYKPTCGIEISQMVIFKDDMNKTHFSACEHVPHNNVKKIMLDFFEKNVWSYFQEQTPEITKQNAFGTYVVTIIPKKIPFWSSKAWRLIALDMIENNEI